MAGGEPGGDAPGLAEHGIVTESWTPLGEDVPGRKEIVDLATRVGRTPAQVVLR